MRNPLSAPTRDAARFLVDEFYSHKRVALFNNPRTLLCIGEWLLLGSASLGHPLFRSPFCVVFALLPFMFGLCER